jgi:hypothetical protein
MAAWMLPVAMALQAGGQMWGAHSQNRANKRNQQAVDARNRQMMDLIMPMLSGNRGNTQGQDALQQLLEGMNPDQLFGAGNQGWNTGQDSYMQMLRDDPLDTTSMFKSWEPIEQRALSQALADSFSQASGLGQRFGSAMMKEEGRVRGEAAENNAARRQTAELGVQDANRQRQMQATQGLAGMGQDQAGLILQMLLGQASGMQGMNALNTQGDLGLLQLLFGGPMMGQQPNAMPGAMGEIGGMMALLPLLMQLNRPTQTTGGTTGGKP